MAESWRHLQLVLPILLSLFAVADTYTCTTSQWYNWNTHQYEYDTSYCSDGCCGNYPEEYCCAYVDYDSTWLVWVIVGSVLGGVFFITLIVVLVCVALKKQGYQGRVIQPVAAQPIHTTVAYSGTSSQYPGSGPGPTVTYNAPPPPAYMEPPKY